MGLLQDRIYQKAEKACIPLAVHFDLTYRCNLRCIHCYLPERDRYPSQSYKEELKRQNRTELTTQEIYGILDQLAECGTLFLTFSGGEIFLRRDIMDILEYARKKRFNVSLLTTGTTGFDETVADRLADMGVHTVDISLYSNEPKVHDAVTGIPGSFNKTIKAIELLSERGMKLNLKCPLMKTNIKSYKSLSENRRLSRAKPVSKPDFRISSKPEGRIFIGDVILHRSGGGLTAHRVIRKRKVDGIAFLITKGDNLRHRDALVSSSEILGKVVAVESGQRRARMDSIPGRTFNYFIAIASSLFLSQILTLLRRSRRLVFRKAD